MKTKLQIIDDTVEYIKERGRAAVEGQCLYHRDDRVCCAVGRCLIDPVKIETGFSGTPARSIPDLELKLKPEYRGHDIAFWDKLQECYPLSVRRGAWTSAPRQSLTRS